MDRYISPMLTLPATLLAFALAVPEAPAALTAKAVLQRLDGTWDQPLYLSGKYVVEKTGAIRLIGQKEPLASFASEISQREEQGLLGFALHPKFAENKKYYVDFTDKRGDTRIVEMSPSGRREILMIKQPYANHNGGHLAFGPDGKLYVGTGDGGCGQRSARQRAEPDGAARQDAAHRRGRGQTGARDPRASGCATRGATASIARPATSTSPTSGRTSGRRSTSHQRPS